MDQPVVTFTTTAAGYTMQASVAVIGSDLLIAITGGDIPHIGTVTICTREQPAETLRFHSHHGRYYKDDILAQRMAFLLRPYLSGNCLITAGVHVDGITQQQIQASGAMAEELGRQVVEWLTDHPVVAREKLSESP